MLDRVLNTSLIYLKILIKDSDDFLKMKSAEEIHNGKLHLLCSVISSPLTTHLAYPLETTRALLFLLGLKDFLPENISTKVQKRFLLWFCISINGSFS